MFHLYFNVQMEWQYMLSGGTSQQQLPNPAPTWLSERAWQDIMALNALPTFEGLAQTFSRHEPDYRRIFDSSQPHRYPLTQTDTYIHLTISPMCMLLCIILYSMFSVWLSREPLPAEWMKKLDSFQRMLVLRCLRVDCLTQALQDFVSAKLGQRFIEPQVNQIYNFW